MRRALGLALLGGMLAATVALALAQATLAVRPSSLPGGDDTALAARGGRVYVLDERTDRIFVCSHAGEILGVFGGIGDGPGQLYQPYGISATSTEIVVYDRGNDRVEFFGLDGAYHGQFPAPADAYGFAASAGGRVYINDPRSGHLITVYDRAGRVVRRFGSLPPLSAQWGVNDYDLDEALRAQAGRAWLAVGGGDIYAASILAPFVREFSPEGRLLADARLEGARSRAVGRLFWGKSSAHPLIASGVVDGHQIIFITKGMCFDAAAGRLLVLMPFSALFSLSADLRAQRSWTVTGAPGWQIWRPAAEANRVWFSRLFVSGVLTTQLGSRSSVTAAAAKGGDRR